MKKLLVVFSLIALLCSCDKNQIDLPVQEEDKVEVEGGSQTGELPEVIYASMSDEDQTPETRTFVDNNVVLWQNGDAISYFACSSHNVKYVYNGETPESKVELEKVGDTGTETELINFSRGIYPYDPEVTVVYEEGIDKITVTYPTTQTYAVKSFGRGANLMIATGDNSQDDKLFFRNACGYLVIKLYGNTTVKNITLSAVDGVSKIAGKATIVTDENKIPVATMSDVASSVVTLDCSNGGKGVALSADAANATEFWFALPPVKIKGGIKIVVTDMNGNIYTKQTTKAVNITRNNVQPMAALEFVSNTPTSNQIWYTKSADAMAKEGAKNPVKFGNGQTNPFDASIKENGHYYDESIGKFVIEFETPVRTIKERAFFDNYEIETIELPDGLETIEELGLGWMWRLKEITIPGSVNTIGFNGFDNCQSMNSITFLPSPTQTPLEIGRSYTPVVNTEQGQFIRSKFTSINLNRELVYVDTDGSPFEPDEEDEGIFYNEEHDKVESVSVTIGGQVRTISDYMFSCLNIQSITIPGTVTSIGNDVFNGCDKLARITFEPSPTGEALTIGWNTDGTDEGLFVDCPLQTVNLNRQLNYAIASEDLDEVVVPFAGKSLGEGVTLGEQVHTLLPYMFSNSGITSLKIPATVMEIKDNAFYKCTTLASVRFEASTEKLTIGFQSGSDEVGPFFQSPLTNIYVDRELVASESYAAARDQWDEGIFSTSFYGSDDPKVTVTLQGNVKTISDYMFSGVQMETIWIPREVETICKGAFYYCYRLYGMTLAHSGTFPTLIEDDIKSDGGGAFKWTLLNDPGLNNNERWIALEDGSDENVTKLKGSSNWSYYAYIIQAQKK
ncbi:MAG: leucine-rich repeat protein [Bacteroidales bacterium]|nr:leucine-rich repeat protein [Bacteroidales bacterium]